MIGLVHLSPNAASGECFKMRREDYAYTMGGIHPEFLDIILAGPPDTSREVRALKIPGVISERLVATAGDIGATRDSRYLLLQ